jgi:sugar-specific transcriptional regulator TrmB
MKTHQLLQKLGFSENEIKVYLAALECGVASAQIIAEKAGVKRTTAYSVLSYLVNRGVVDKTKIKGKTRFVPEPPQRLLLLVREMEDGIKASMPELEAIYNKNEVKPKITYYEGIEGIKSVFEDSLREKPPVMLMWLTDDYFTDLPGYSDEYIKARVKLNMRGRRIAPAGSLWIRQNKKRDARELSETIAVPPQLMTTHIEVMIYNHKVAFMNFGEKFGVIIESKAIAEAMKQAYELSWIGAKSVEVK